MAPQTSQPGPQEVIISPFVTESVLPGFWERMTSPKFRPTDDFSLEVFHDQRHLLSISQATGARRWHPQVLYRAKSVLIVNLHAHKFTFTGKYGSISRADHQRAYTVVLWLKVRDSARFAKERGRRDRSAISEEIQGEIENVIREQINILERSNTSVDVVKSTIANELGQILSQHYSLTIERQTIDLGRDTVAEQIDIIKLEGELARARQIQEAQGKQLAQFTEKNLDWQHERDQQLQGVLTSGMRNQLQELLAKGYSIEEAQAQMQNMLPEANMPQIGDLVNRIQRDEYARGISSGPDTSNLLPPGMPLNPRAIPAPNLPINAQANNGNLYNTYSGNNPYPQLPFPTSLPAPTNPSMAQGPVVNLLPNAVADRDGGVTHYASSVPTYAPNTPLQPQAPSAGIGGMMPLASQSLPNPVRDQTMPLTSSGRHYCANLGFVVEKLTLVQKANLEEELGPTLIAFIITHIDPAGAATGKLQPGDYISQIAGVDISTEHLLMKAEHDALSIPKLVVRVVRAQEDLDYLLWDRAFPKA